MDSVVSRVVGNNVFVEVREKSSSPADVTMKELIAATKKLFESHQAVLDYEAQAGAFGLVAARGSHEQRKAVLLILLQLVEPVLEARDKRGADAVYVAGLANAYVKGNPHKAHQVQTLFASLRVPVTYGLVLADEGVGGRATARFGCSIKFNRS